MTVMSEGFFLNSKYIKMGEIQNILKWLKFKLDHSPLFSSAKLKIAIAAVKVILVSSDG